MIDRLGIIDIRNIIRAIDEDYNVDFSDYALTSFKRRLEKVVKINNLNSADELIAKLKDNYDFFETFLNDISISDTEMFRDPSLWKELKENLLPKIHDSKFRIWLPGCTTGEELYSITIILSELDLLNKVDIYATSLCQKHLDFIKRGAFDLKKMEINNANYNRLKGNYKLTDYYTVKNNKAYLDTELIKNVKFEKHYILYGAPASNIKLILYRNKMIYFNQQLQNKVLDVLHNTLIPGGHLIIGVMEAIENFNNDKKFIVVNEAENIFKKTVTQQ